MSYPEPRYHGTTGELSARLRSGEQAPDLLIGERVQVHYLATQETTNGQFGLYRWDMSPDRAGAEPHFHRSFSESFFVLSGTVHLYDGTQWVPRTAGDFEFVPEGGIHGFRNESGQPVSMLLLFAPGAPREGYFEGLAKMLAEGTSPSQDFLVAHDNHYV